MDDSRNEVIYLYWVAKNKRKRDETAKKKNWRRTNFSNTFSTLVGRRYKTNKNI